MSERDRAVEALRDNFRRRIETAIGGEQGLRILGMFDWAADEVAAARAALDQSWADLHAKMAAIGAPPALDEFDSEADAQPDTYTDGRPIAWRGIDSVRASALMPAPALDVERLAQALESAELVGRAAMQDVAEWLAAEYARLAQQDDGPAVAPFTRREYEPPAIRPACRHCSAPELHAAGQQDAPRTISDDEQDFHQWAAQQDAPEIPDYNGTEDGVPRL